MAVSNCVIHVFTIWIGEQGGGRHFLLNTSTSPRKSETASFDPKVILGPSLPDKYASGGI